MFSLDHGGVYAARVHRNRRRVPQRDPIELQEPAREQLDGAAVGTAASCPDAAPRPRRVCSLHRRRSHPRPPYARQAESMPHVEPVQAVCDYKSWVSGHVWELSTSNSEVGQVNGLNSARCAPSHAALSRPSLPAHPS